MKNYKQDFDDKLQDDSYDDGTLLSIARDYIAELTEKVQHWQNLFYNAVNLGQLDEQWEDKESLFNELDITQEEWDSAMDGTDYYSQKEKRK